MIIHGKTQLNNAVFHFRQAIIKKYGEIKKEYLPIIEQFKTLYYVYLSCRNDIIINGIYKQLKNGCYQKKPSIPILVDAHRKIMGIYKSFSIFPKETDIADDTEEFINSLIND